MSSTPLEDGRISRDQMLEAARELVARGYHLTLLYGTDAQGTCDCGSRCKSPGKHPRERDWTKRPIHTTEDLVKRWNQLPPGTPNIGVIPDDGLVVIDVDRKNGKKGAETLVALQAQHGPLGDPDQTTPSGGWHFVCRLPPGVDGAALPNHSGVQEGIDILRTGRQFVAAPSQIGMRRYQGTLPPREQVRELPAPWLAFLQSLGRGARSRPSVTDPAALQPRLDGLKAPSTEKVREVVRWIPNPADNGRDKYVGMAHAIKGACGPQAEGEGLAIFLEWAARWDGPVDPVRDERAFTTIRWENVHTGWPMLWRLADRHGYNAAAERLAEAQEAFAAAPLPDEATPEATGPGLVGADSTPSELQVSAAYRKALRDAVGQARSDIPNAVDRAMHFEAIAYLLGQRFAVHPRAVREGLRALDAEAECANAYAPPVEWLGPEDRDRLASAVPRYLITDYLFADRAIHIAYGVPGSRKTFVAISWLLALATGRPWGGRYPVQQGGALLFAGEAAATLRVRRAAALAALGVTPELAATLPFGVVPQLPPLGSADGVDAVRRLVEAHYYTRHQNVPLRVIAFDTLTRLSQRAGSSTTDPKEYGVLLDRVEQIAQATDASIVLLAHSPEGNAEKPTGTYQTRANADSVMKVERVDANSSRLTVEKAKDDIEGTPLLLQFAQQDVRQWLATSYELEGRPLPGPLADARGIQDFDANTDSLPSETDLVGAAADPVRATRDAALRRQFTSLVLTEASPEPRANRRGSRQEEIERTVLDWIDRHPGASTTDLRTAGIARGQDVDRARLRLVDRGLVENRGSASRHAYYLADPHADEGSAKP